MGRSQRLYFVLPHSILWFIAMQAFRIVSLKEEPTRLKRNGMEISCIDDLIRPTNALNKHNMFTTCLFQLYMFLWLTTWVECLEVYRKISIFSFEYQKYIDIYFCNNNFFDYWQVINSWDKVIFDVITSLFFSLKCQINQSFKFFCESFKNILSVLSNHFRRSWRSRQFPKWNNL